MLDKQIKENLEQMLKKSKEGRTIEGSVDLIIDVLCKSIQEN